MLDKKMTKVEIEEALNKKGEYVQIDYLTRFIKENPPLDLKKFAYNKLAEIYERKGMFIEAARISNNLAELSITFSEKSKYFVKETELYILAGTYEKAEESMKKALGEANTSDRDKIYSNIKDFYKKIGENFEREKRRKNALRIYEKLLEFRMSDSERQDIKNRLNAIYTSLGVVKLPKR